MSVFKRKAEEIRAVGEQSRGEFTPHGAPLRLYRYWLDNTHSFTGERIRAGKQKENFCHFWRVVAFWAPSLWLVEKITDFCTSKWSIPFLVLFGIGVFSVLFMGLGISLIEFLLVLGAILASVALAVGLGVGMGHAQKKWPRAFKSMFVAFIWMVLVSMAFAIISAGGLVAAIIIACLAATATLFWMNIDRIVDYDTRRRSRKRAEARKKYSDAAMFFKEHGRYPWDAKPRNPGKIAKFFSGIGEFLVLVFQVVRVSKWKICPLVEIERKARNV